MFIDLIVIEAVDLWKGGYFEAIYLKFSKQLWWKVRWKKVELSTAFSSPAITSRIGNNLSTLKHNLLLWVSTKAEKPPIFIPNLCTVESHALPNFTPVYPLLIPRKIASELATFQQNRQAIHFYRQVIHIMCKAV